MTIILVGPQTRLNDLVRKFESNRLDLLATLSKQPHRPNPDGTPRQLNSSGGVLHIPRGEYRRIGDIAECAFVATASLRIATSCMRFAGMKISR